MAWDKSIIEGQLPVLPQRRQEEPTVAVRVAKGTTRTAFACRWTTSPAAIGSATSVAINHRPAQLHRVRQAGQQDVSVLCDQCPKACVVI